MVEEGRQTQALKLPFPTGETNKIIAPMETIHREVTHFSYLETWKQILKVRPAIFPGEEKSGWNICAGIAFSPHKHGSYSSPMLASVAQLRQYNWNLLGM